MKLATIRQRLNTILVLLTMLLLVGVGLALWIQKARSSATQLADQLTGARDGIYYDVLSLSETLRALTLDPKSELEKKHQHDAATDLKSRLDFIRNNFSGFPELLGTVNELEGFVLGRGRKFWFFSDSRAANGGERCCQCADLFERKPPGVGSATRPTLS
ncbi:MAG TPA: hypothetical protein VL361_13430 [Candidatus Limnocylindrales bacterium]|jgi:hypothetical protein|nr:hypothetical protein [Candidatus Limnocylindrales bacterium]